jgi:hypothetical protein
MKLPLVSNKVIQASDHGQTELEIKKLSHGDLDRDGLSMILTNEYARMVEENPDYEFGILSDPSADVLRITWRKRT